MNPVCDEFGCELPTAVHVECDEKTGGYCRSHAIDALDWALAFCRGGTLRVKVETVTG